MRYLLIFLLLLPTIALAQEDVTTEDIWAVFRPLIGQWEGKGIGPGGESTVETSFEFTLDNRFIMNRTKSISDPSTEVPEGSLHRDLGLISYDKNRKVFVFRQFHTEGFVNTYVLDSVSTDFSRLVFITEHIESLEPGWRAKLIYEFQGENKLRTALELAPPGSDFSLCNEHKLRRKK